MESVQVRLTKEQIQALDKFVSVKLFSSRNEAVREAVRRLIAQYAQLAEFKWHIFGPRDQDDMMKIIKGSGDAESIRVPKDVVAALEKLI